MSSVQPAPAMSDAEALKILDLATQPQAAGKLDRLDYARIEIALAHLRQRLTPTPAPLPRGKAKP